MRILLLVTASIALVSGCSDSSAPAAKPSPLATVTIVSGNNQQGTAGAALTQPIVIQAVDSNGKAAVGASVILAVSGNGALNPSSGTTDSDGQVSLTWTLSTTAGADTLYFSVVQSSSNSLLQGIALATGTP
jgi:hypothetical protein